MKMKTKEYREMDTAARLKELTDMLREQFNLRMQHATGQLADNSKLRTVRRNIARVRTITNEKAGQ